MVVEGPVVEAGGVVDSDGLDVVDSAGYDEVWD